MEGYEARGTRCLGRPCCALPANIRAGKVSAALAVEGWNSRDLMERCPELDHRNCKRGSDRLYPARYVFAKLGCGRGPCRPRWKPGRGGERPGDRSKPQPGYDALYGLRTEK